MAATLKDSGSTDGRKVRAVAAGLDNRLNLERLLSELDADPGLPPLGGVIHAAEALVSGSTANGEEPEPDPFLAEVADALVLHQATAKRDLDLFVLLTSWVGVIGRDGQARRAAASATLDQLARWRRTCGLAGQAIAWGPRPATGAPPDQRTTSALTPEQCREGLDRLVGTGAADALVAEVEPRALAAAAPDRFPLFDELRSGSATTPKEAEDLVSQLREASGARRLEMLVRFLQAEVQTVLRLHTPPSPDVGFFDLGMDSLMAVEIRNRVARTLPPEAVGPATVLFDYPSVESLARRLARTLDSRGASGQKRLPAAAVEAVPRGSEDERIAVVGMACRFPGGRDLAEFWEQLRRGESAVSRGRPRGFPGGSVSDPSFWGAFLPDVDRFDAEFFRIAPVEAELMDPQQRLLLETSWSALEDAAIPPASLKGSRTGVFAGLWNNEYRDFIPAPTAGEDRGLYAATGNSASTAIGRIAFTLGLRGPAVAVDTACSSSLVAMHHAAIALCRREADLALAGGVNTLLTAEVTNAFAAAGMLAADGRCKTFDAAADGYVRGEGCGILVLKRLADAERDGDRILGLLSGSAVNQDGASAGLTAPNGPAQERVIREALSRAGVTPSAVDYLEAHGTGTELGDPIEVQAAAAVYGDGRDPARPLLVGSVKTNIGHLESAAGVAGVIKVLLAMREGTIPQHLNFERPNAQVDWERLPVRVVCEATAWPDDRQGPFRAGVSSFGFSGTNAHVILESYPAGKDPREEPAGHRLLPLSGRSPAALSDLAARYLEWLGRRPVNVLLADMAWTAGVGRDHFAVRAGLVFGDERELREQLEPIAAAAHAAGDGAGKVAFLFTGQGSQWTGMGRLLYEQEPAAREVFDRAEEVFRDTRGKSLLAVMFGDDGAIPDLDATEWTQPAVFALEAALVALWKSVGIEPDAVLGHSVGEIAAAHAAGAFGLEDGLRFAAERGALMGSLPAGGGMAAVFASPEVVSSALAEVNEDRDGAALALAADNGGHQVVSGPLELLAELEDRLRPAEIRTKRLPADRAFHSGLMDPVLGELESAASRLSGRKLSVPFVTNVTGQALEPEQGLDAGYWRRQARSPVAFATGVRTLAESGTGVLIEVGPRSVLGPIAATAWPSENGSKPWLIASLGEPGASSGPGFPGAVARAYEAGLPVSFAGLYSGRSHRRVSLPTYPFQGQPYWAAPRGRADGAAAGSPLGVRRDLPDGEISFETSTADLGWLAEHRVFGRVVAPAAFFGAQALEALETVGIGDGAGVVEELRIERPLIASDAAADPPGGAGARTVQFVLGPPLDAGERSFRIFSRGEEEEPWLLHGEGRLTRRPAPEAGNSSGRGPEVGQVVPSPGAAADLYRQLSVAGIELGPSFRAVRELSCGPQVALGELEAGRASPAAGPAVHPALLDACFQVAVAALGDFTGGGAGAWLPTGWRSLRLARKPPSRFECLAVVREEPERDGAGESRTRIADVFLRLPDGAVFGAAEGLELRRANRATMLSAFAWIEDLQYRLEWRTATDQKDFLSPRSLPAPGAVASASAPGACCSPPDLEPDLETLCRAYASKVLAGLGWNHQRPTPTGDLRRELRVLEEHRNLLEQLVELGSAHRGPDAETLAAAVASRYPELAWEVGIVRHCAEGLPEVLRGRLDPAELLVSSPGRNGGNPPYLEDPARAIAGVISTLAADFSPDRPLRVMEMGGGAFGLLERALELVPADASLKALITEESARPLALRRERSPGRFPVETRLYDPSRNPAGQGLPIPACDFLILGDGTAPGAGQPDLLRHCRRLVAPAGMLAAQAGFGCRGFRALTAGVFGGAGQAETADLLRALQAVGFGDAATIGTPSRDLVLSRAPSEWTPGSGSWLLAAPRSGPGLEVAGELAQELRVRNQSVTVAAVPDPSADGTAICRTEPSRRSSWAELLKELPEDVALQGVAHLGALSGHGPEATTKELAQDLEAAVASAVALLQGLDDTGRKPAAGVWLVTRGGQVANEAAKGELTSSALWGLGRVAARELPDLGVRMLDLDPANRPDATVIARELLFPDAENEVAVRGGVRMVSRLVRPPIHAPRTARSAPRRKDRTVLVTGAFGGIGRRVARWLAGEGFGGIVLNGRRPPAALAADLVDALGAGGAAVRVESADVGDRSAVEKMLEDVESSGLPPLGGVIHCAGVLSDGSLPNLDWGSFEQVFRPKVLGAWNLHRTTLEHELDLFVLFSSASGILGNPGQSNYAAANAFLDQLARYRRAIGLNGQSIAWGAWSGAGMAEASRERLTGRTAADGFGWITPEQGLNALSRIVNDDIGTPVVASLDWEALAQRESPLLAELVAAQPKGGRAFPADKLVTRLQRSGPADRRDLLVRFLQDEVGAILRLPSPPAPETGFFELGMDSLMAMELRSRVNRSLGGKNVVPSTGAFDHPSVLRMAEYLARQVGPAAETADDDRPAAGRPSADEALDDLLRQVEAELQEDD